MGKAKGTGGGGGNRNQVDSARTVMVTWQPELRAERKNRKYFWTQPESGNKELLEQMILSKFASLKYDQASIDAQLSQLRPECSNEFQQECKRSQALLAMMWLWLLTQ